MPHWPLVANQGRYIRRRYRWSATCSIDGVDLRVDWAGRDPASSVAGGIPQPQMQDYVTRCKPGAPDCGVPGSERVRSSLRRHRRETAAWN